MWHFLASRQQGEEPAWARGLRQRTESFICAARLF
jgi:hypothetical protein